MNLSMPLGQYLPGDSIVHTLDARAKFIALVSVTVALFASTTWWTLGVCAAFLALVYFVAHVPLRFAVRGLKPVLFLLVFTILFNAIGAVGSDAPFQIMGFGIKSEGLIRGLYFATRIITLILTTSLLTYTTSPVDLTDAFVSLMRPLAHLHVPVEDIAMMFSIALRFIPTTAEEAEKIVTAQAARGAQFTNKRIFQRLKAWIPVLIPLFVNLFRRADLLATAMESRCYRGEGRTHMRVHVLHRRDVVAMLAFPLLCAALIIWL